MIRISPSLIPIPILILLSVSVYFSVNSTIVYEPPWLLLLSNTLFVTLTALAVAYIAMKAYRATGLIQFLLLGCGVLIFGIGAVEAGLLRNIPDRGANLNVTLHNIGALGGGLFHFFAAMILLCGLSPEARSRWKNSGLILSYGGSVAVMALLAVASLKGLIPPFQIPGEIGFTPLRQQILGTADVLFVFSCLIFSGTYFKNQEVFLYWYSCALALTVISLTTSFVQAKLGSPIGWVARSAQYLAGGYFLMSILAAQRSAQAKNTSLDAVLTASLSPADEKFRALAENSPDIIQRFDVHLRHIYMNPAGLRRFGKPIECVLGMSLEKMGLSEEYASRWNTRVKRVLEEGKPMEAEDLATVEGEVRYFQSRFVPEYGMDGTVNHVLVVSRDLTESKRAEDALRESEVRYRTLSEATFEGIAITEQGRFIDANEQLLNLLHCSREELIGHSVVEIITPEDRERVMSNIRANLESHIEHDMLRKNGGALTVEAHGKTIHSEGRLIRFTAIRDITERKQAEESLRKSQAQLKALIHQAPISIAMFDRDMNYLATSGRWLVDYGRGHADLIGLNHYEVNPDLPPRWKQVHQLSLAGAYQQNAEDRWIRTDGRQFWMRWAVLPWTDEHGSIGGIIISTEDITEHKSIEAELAEKAQQLREADRRKDEFLAMLAHELRNPLAPIRNAVQILKRSENDPVRIRWCREVINRQIEHLVRLVDDLLDVSRISRGRIELRKEPLEVREFIESAVETSQPLIDARRQAFSITLPPEPLWVKGDKIRLAQVVSNLLNNAAKYTDEGGEIWLIAECCEDEICIRVCDNGCGIDASTLPSLFDLFYQAEGGLDRSQGGLGIGLSIVHRLATMHGGDVRAFSAGLGLGSEFVVHLPKLMLEETLPDFANASSTPAQQGLRILVVDDNSDAAESLGLLLEFQGHRIHVAHDGPSALELAQTGWPEVVLLDIGLPGMDGYQVAAALRETYARTAMRLIALTGYGQAEDQEKSLAVGFDEHFIKPVDLETLQKLLAQYQTNK